MSRIVSSQKLGGKRKALEGAKRPTAGDEPREFFAMDGIMSRSPGWARATTSRGEGGRVPPFIEKIRRILLFLFGLFLSSTTLFAAEYANFVQLGYEGKGELEFIKPEDLVLGPDDEMVVADTKNNRIQVLSSEGVFERFITLAKGEASETKELPAKVSQSLFLDRPVGLAFDPDWNLLVSCLGNEQILVFNFSAGTLKNIIGTGGSGPGQFKNPMDIDVDSDGRIAVADYGNKRVQILDKTGKYLAEKLYQEETKKSGLRSLQPKGVSWLPSGDIIVSYPSFHQVVCFPTKEDGVRWRYGIKGSEQGELREPSFLTKSPKGNIFISDSGNNRLVEIAADGFFVRHISSRGTAPGRLLEPKGIKMNKQEFLCLVDQGNNRVQIFLPGKVDLILKEVRNLIAEKKWDDAYPKIEQVLNLSPANLDAKELLVVTLHFFGDRCREKYEFDKAEEYYRRVLSYNPSDPQVQPKLDSLFWASNRDLIAKAATVFGAIILGLIVLWLMKLIIYSLLFAEE